MQPQNQKLEQTIRSIQPLPRALAPRVQAHLDDLTKPRGSLGRLEELALQGIPEAPLKAFLEHHGFKSLLARLGAVADAPVAAAQKPGTMLSGLNLTGPFNVTGNPVLSAPCGPDAGGLPASVQIVAAPFQEALAYRAGRVIERALGARDLRPDIAFS